MAQLFTPRADARLRLGIVIAGLLAALGAAMAYAMARSDAAWAVGRPADQPIPFSHAIHAGELGLECSFCHTGALHSAGAAMPAGELCLGCHQRVWNVSAQFAPLRSALESGTSTTWASVHRLPDHVRFHHGAHAAAGVDCSTCHGAVESMPHTVKAESLSMGWCLDCHRDPASRGAVPASAWTAPYRHAGVEITPLTRCTVCHR